MPENKKTEVDKVGREIARVREEIETTLAQSPRSEARLEKLRAELKSLYRQYCALVSS